MSRAFVRFYAAYEVPEFKGKIFTEKQFRDWYKKEYNSDFDGDWSGFNINSDILIPFYNGIFDPLSEEEKQVLELLKNAEGRFAIIATFSDYKYIHETYPHEVAHALWEFNASYKSEIRQLLSRYNLKDLRDFIQKEWHYDPQVMEDELQAFLLTNKGLLEEHGFDTAPYASVMSNVKKIFDKHN